MRGTFPKFLEEYKYKIIRFYNDSRIKALFGKEECYPAFDYDLDFYAWPQTNGSTNPFGIGGMMITSHTVYALVDTYGPGDAVLIMMDRIQYISKFEFNKCKFDTRGNYMKLEEVVV